MGINKMSFMESLLGCFSDCNSCVIVSFVPCGMACIQGSAVALANQTSCMNPCCCQLYLCCIGGAINRGKIREALQYDGSCCIDLCIHFFCGPCAVCQEYREAKTKFAEKAVGQLEKTAQFIGNQ